MGEMKGLNGEARSLSGMQFIGKRRESEVEYPPLPCPLYSSD